MPITKQELIEVMDMYIAPIYNVIGAAAAAFVLFGAVWLVLWPFLKKRRIR